jgi:ferredoxin-NADP reductase
MKVGVQVDVDGPIGGFTLPATFDERRFIFIAGGSGIAPLRAMLRQALGRPHPEIALLYSARTPDEFAYEDELRRLADEARIGLRQTITRCRGTDTWTGGRGRLAAADLEPFIEDPATRCFVCGPATFVRDIDRLLQELGVGRERIHIERWRAPGPPPPDMLADSKDPRGSDRRRAHCP